MGSRFKRFEWLEGFNEFCMLSRGWSFRTSEPIEPSNLSNAWNLGPVEPPEPPELTELTEPV
jgi:hypothetical protein